MRSTIIGFIGGPHSGKTVAALRTTAELMCRGESAEMARECIKHWAHEGRAVSAYDEQYICGKQIKEESLLLGKVRYIVTDRPVLVSVPFVDLYAPQATRDAVYQAVWGYYKQLRTDGHRAVFIILKRGRSYDTRGRWESRRGAELIDSLIEQTLGEFGVEVWRATQQTAVQTALQVRARK